MNNSFLEKVDQTKDGSSLKKPLVISAILVFFIVFSFLYWLDKTSTEAAEQAFASAKDFIAQEDHEQAIEKLNEAIKHKEKAQYYYTKYKVLSAEEKYNEAGINLDKAFKHDSRNAGYAFEAGYFYVNQGADGQKGLDYLKKAMEIEPKNSDYKLTYGSTLSQFGRFDEGIKVLEQLAKDDPNYYSVWNDLATLYNYGGYPKKAIETRLQAIKKFPDDAYHWFWLANTYDIQGNKVKAVEVYKKSISLAPEWGAQASYRIASLTGEKVPEKYREIIEDSIPVLYRNTHAYIRANIAGYSGLFLLDTGATDTVLYEGFIDKNDIDIGEDNPTTQYETAGGIISAPVVYADTKIGRFSVENVRVAVIPSSKLDKDTDGIIGMNILKHFNVRMDNLRGTLLFSRK